MMMSTMFQRSRHMVTLPLKLRNSPIQRISSLLMSSSSNSESAKSAGADVKYKGVELKYDCDVEKLGPVLSKVWRPLWLCDATKVTPLHPALS